MSEGTTQGMSYQEACMARPIGHISKSTAIVNNALPTTVDRIELGEKQRPEDVNVYTADVVDALMGKIAELHEQLEGHTQAVNTWKQRCEEERNRKFTEPGWFVPRRVVSDIAEKSLNNLIHRAKACRICDVDLRENGRDVRFQGDWIKYMQYVTGVDSRQENETWVVKLGAVVSKFHRPTVVNFKTPAEQDEIIKRLMANLGQPQSQSLCSAFKQFANELMSGFETLPDIVAKVTGVPNQGLTASNIDQAVRVELPADTSHYLHPYEVPAKKVIADTPAPEQQPARSQPVNKAAAEAHLTKAIKEIDCVRCPLAKVAHGCCGGWNKAKTEPKPVYSEAALNDPTNLQKATIMGLVGTEAQQEEAREFLTQYLAQMNSTARTHLILRDGMVSL